MEEVPAKVLCIFTHDAHTGWIRVSLYTIESKIRTHAYGRFVDSYGILCTRAAMSLRAALAQRARELDAVRRHAKRTVGVAWPLLRPINPLEAYDDPNQVYALAISEFFTV